MLGLSYTALARWDEVKHRVLKCHLGQIPVTFEIYIYMHICKNIFWLRRRKRARRRAKMAKIRCKRAEMRPKMAKMRLKNKLPPGADTSYV